MSRGLGLSFLTGQMCAFYQADVSKPVILKGGVTVGLPRYYRDKLFSEKQKNDRTRQLLPKQQDKCLEQRGDPLFPQRVEKMYKKASETIGKTD